jgi:plastocyanin
MIETTAPLAPLVHAPARGTHLAILGFLMAAGGPALIVVAMLLFGLDLGDSLFFFVPPMLLGLVGAALVRRPRTGPKVAGVVLGVLAGVAAFPSVFGLAKPASFFDFVPGFLVLPGAFLALGAGITSIRSTRAERLAGPGERRAVLAIVAALGLAAAASGVLTIAGRETVAGDLAADADVVVELQNIEFDQASYEVPEGGTVLVRNSDPFAHTFTVQALGIDISLNPGSEKLLRIDGEPGAYVLFCEPHTSDPDDPGDDDMAAELRLG